MKTDIEITKKIKEAKRLASKDIFKAIRALIDAMDKIKEVNR